MPETSPADTLLALEREALDRWSSGDPAGYLLHAAQDVSYFDDLGAQGRLDGLPAALEHTRSLEGSVPPHDYRIEKPRVQVHGDLGIVTLLYRPSVGGQPGQPWRSTTVYHRSGDGWRMVHANWSILKEETDPGA